MKKLLFITTIFVLSFALLPGFSFAQEMMGSDNGHTAREEAEGKCENLSDDDFEALGEHFMGQMAGEQHEAMNNMMIQMMGEQGEEQTHIAMGKRMSGCQPDAPMPNMMNGSMMGMMMAPLRQGFEGQGGGGNPIGWGLGSLLFTLTWIVWFIVGILAATWLWKQIKR